MRLILIFMFCYILSACASTPPVQIRYITKPIEVEVPVILPCDVVVPYRVPYATEELTKQSTSFMKIKGLLIERSQRAATEDQLRELLDACTTLEGNNHAN